MSYTNFESKEIHCKLIYLGPKGAGKTESLRSIFKKTSHDYKNGTITLVNDAKSTGFFDFLPISLGIAGNFHIKLHLFTLPSPLIYPSVCDVIMKGVDGYVFIADSQMVKLLDNLEAFEQARNIFLTNGYQLANMPGAIQYNRQDCEDLAAKEDLSKLLNFSGVPEFLTIATQSIGTLETLFSVAQQILQRLAAG